MRQCQPCTACCDGWVQITVKGCEAYPGHPCPHSTGKGVMIMIIGRLIHVGNLSVPG
jgi:hypothetical protein